MGKQGLDINKIIQQESQKAEQVKAPTVTVPTVDTEPVKEAPRVTGATRVQSPVTTHTEQATGEVENILEDIYTELTEVIEVDDNVKWLIHLNYVDSLLRIGKHTTIEDYLTQKKSTLLSIIKGIQIVRKIDDIDVSKTDAQSKVNAIINAIEKQLSTMLQDAENILHGDLDSQLQELL